MDEKKKRKTNFSNNEKSVLSELVMKYKNIIGNKRTDASTNSQKVVALRDDEPSKADVIHKALMVDHVSEVSSWMPGVRQLIYNCLARSELLAIDKKE